MRLFFVQAENDQANMDLFVTAVNTLAARQKWRDNFDGWDKPTRITLYVLPGEWPQPEGVITWASLPSVTMLP